MGEGKDKNRGMIAAAGGCAAAMTEKFESLFLPGGENGLFLCINIHSIPDSFEKNVIIQMW